MSVSSRAQQRQFPCRQCGANLAFEPGVYALKCPYCQTENEIQQGRDVVREEDFYAALADQGSVEATAETLTVKCEACGAESALKPDVTADKCVFCGSAIVAQGRSVKRIKPKCLLPFHVKREEAMGAFRRWVAGLWFAPGDLARFADANAVKGVYIPYWTYDCETESDYAGERGDDYWDTETYTTHENGKWVTKTRQVRKTRWWPVSGRVGNPFDDILILASHSLPRKYTERLEPWDLGNLVPYSDEYLAGFVTESYQIDLATGFELAKGPMDGEIRQTICRDIGGDHQRIHSVDTRYFDITFKHVLLPLWISAYFYRGRTFRFLINARTGEVSGERPYSAWKIFFLVVFILVVVGMVLLLVSQS
jgi:Zn finger protein HypA/HybF involved in hydrogenase expression